MPFACAVVFVRVSCLSTIVTILLQRTGSLFPSATALCFVDQFL